MFHHHPTRRFGPAAALALSLVAFQAGAQQSANAPSPSPNASAVFQGRPLMAGAQAGLGAQAGPAQGGIGLQGSDGVGLNLRRPRNIEEPASPLPPVACVDLPRTAAGEQPLCLPGSQPGANTRS